MCGCAHIAVVCGGGQLGLIGEFVVVEHCETVAQGFVDGEPVTLGQRRGDETVGMLVEGVELCLGGVGDHGVGSVTSGKPVLWVWIARVNVTGNDELV